MTEQSTPSTIDRPAPATPQSRLAIRELEHSDIPEAARILAEGFPRHSSGRWQDRLRTLAEREPAPGTPLFGYALDVDGLQGVGLIISSLHGPPEARQTVVNGSALAVRPAYRGAGAMALYRRCTSGDGMTFSNLSASAHMRKLIQACGFTERTAGIAIAVGVAARAQGRKRRVLSLSDAERSGLSAERAEMMRYHEARGCLTFCVADNDRLAPFMFMPRSMRFGVRVAHLIYCERMSDLIENSWATTVKVWKSGCAALLVDASGPIEGLKGRYFPGVEPRYYRGPTPFYTIDYSYSELIYFGF